MVPSLRELVEQVALLLEVDRRPFKRAQEIGPGPRRGWPDGPKHRKRDYWTCKCGGYQCRCKGKEGENKKVSLDPKWKSSYNSEYKAWHKARLHKAAPGHFKGYNKKDTAYKTKRRARLNKQAQKRRKYKKQRKRK